MLIPKSDEEMKSIIERWAETQSCDIGDDMRYFAGEVLAIIEFMVDESNGDK